MKKLAYIFDVDGTLADNEHRLLHIKDGKKDWETFFSEAANDKVYEPIRRILWAFQEQEIYSKDYTAVIICTARPKKYEAATTKWLNDNNIFFDTIYTREDGDFREDSIVKSEMLDKILADGYEVIAVFDDRQRVVDMWRRRGLACLQVRTWEERVKNWGHLTLLIGPSGAGKTSYISNKIAGLDKPPEIISSDSIRELFCNDFRDQSNNEQVFQYMRDLALLNLKNGIDVVIDATNIRRKDRLFFTTLLPKEAPKTYVIINRPMEEKYRDGSWRNEVNISGLPLIEKHEQVFQANLKDILQGDGQQNVEIIDVRTNKN